MKMIDEMIEAMTEGRGTNTLQILTKHSKRDLIWEKKRKKHFQQNLDEDEPPEKARDEPRERERYRSPRERETS